MINKLIGVTLLSFVILGVTIVVTSRQGSDKKRTSTDINSLKKAILTLTKKVDKQQQVMQSQPKVAQAQPQPETTQPQPQPKATQPQPQPEVIHPKDVTPPTPAFSYMLRSDSFDKEDV